MIGMLFEQKLCMEDRDETTNLCPIIHNITLKYTGEDNVVQGYTIHIENICVEPDLLALYRNWNEAGREQLPALPGGQALGRALAGEISVSVRDNGTFLDPRSRKDWWTDH